MITALEASINLAPCAIEATTSKPTASGLRATSTFTPPCAAIFIASAEKIAILGLTAEPKVVLFKYELTKHCTPAMLPKKPVHIALFWNSPPANADPPISPSKSA